MNLNTRNFNVSVQHFRTRDITRGPKLVLPISLKAQDNRTIGNYSKNIVSIQNLLGNMQDRRAFESIKHCEKRVPLICYSNKDTRPKAPIVIRKHTLSAARLGFLSLFSFNLNDQLTQHFHRFVSLCIMLEITIPVFDNYQMCPVPFMLCSAFPNAKHNAWAETRLIVRALSTTQYINMVITSSRFPSFFMVFFC